MSWEKAYLQFLTLFKDKLDWEAVTSNENVSMKMFRENPQLPWSIKHLSANPNIDTKTFLDYVVKKKENFVTTWLNLNVTDPENLPKKYISRSFLSKNKHLTLEVIKSNPDTDWCDSWNWRFICLNSNFSISDIPRKRRNGDAISRRKNISLEEFKLYFHEIEWDRDMISFNIKGDLDDILEVDYKWNYDELVTNKNIFPEDLLRYPKLFDAFCLRKAIYNPNVTFRFAESHCAYWSRHILNVHMWINYTKEDIEKDPLNEEHVDNTSVDWIYLINAKPEWSRALSYRIDADMAFIMNHPDYSWDFFKLSSNTFSSFRKDYCLRMIQRWWLDDVYYNPKHPVGFKRLKEEAEKVCDY